MDAVLDISARAAAMIVVIQQLCTEYSKVLSTSNEPFTLLKKSEAVRQVLNQFAISNEKFVERSVQLIWISNASAQPEDVAKCFLKRADALLTWLWKEENLIVFLEKDDPKELWTEDDFQKTNINGDESNQENQRKESNKIVEIELGYLPSPDSWRTMISRLLYQIPQQRLDLAKCINYLPLQVVLGSGGECYGALQQRILQEWEISRDDLKIIVAAGDLKRLKKCIDFKPILAKEFLKNDEKLLNNLGQQHIPLSFEYIFDQELEEIAKNRLVREQEQLFANKIPSRRSNGHEADQNLSNSDSKNISLDSSFKNHDPRLMARKMKLKAIAFSGGGIRSATFNLGILQGFAKAGFLAKLDYISTVSGGGYLGSWLASWIKREGSVLKVSNRLNPVKSSDPQAEEVRPIRWLRMYSNYLTPNAGIMSVDSWTVGMTVLRNMLLNQTIILLLLFTLLIFGRLLFLTWAQYLILLTDKWIYIWSNVLIISGSILAGAGMNFYHKKTEDNQIETVISSKKRIGVSIYILAIGYILAVCISAWLFSKKFPSPDSTGLASAFNFLKPSSYSIFLSLIIVACLGRYDKCVPEKGYKKIEGLFFITIFSVLGAVAGWVLLVVAWKIIAFVKLTTLITYGKHFGNYGEALAFIIGPPLVAESLSLTIVIRMALLGAYFPDERREWWGRMGGIIHRTAFLWILVTSATLIGQSVIYHYIPSNPVSKIIATAGGWAALVAGAVKAAFSSKSSNTSDTSISNTITNILARTGPYLFGMGLLIFLPVLLNNILNYYLIPEQQKSIAFIFYLTIIMTVVTFGLAWRLGVNEFSMHHFYKNRLIRAYLGATRSRFDRKITSSPFTGFDSDDDVLLSSLIHDNKYYGPYPILNTTLNASQVSDLARQDRKGESFIFSPLYCGFDFSRKRALANATEKSYDYGYRPTSGYGYAPNGPYLGSAMAISGAAANPNQGYHSSPATAFLLTAFNLRLGWWIGNPRKKFWNSSDPNWGLPYLISNLIGKSNTSDNYVSLSDGGHFDNMGLYELIRRRVSLIILGDGEQDDKFICEGLANAIRLCRIDFGVEIDIDVSPITTRIENLSHASFAIGKIVYPGEPETLGALIYMKSSITKDQPVDVREYGLKNKSFPHQSTSDQSFNEAQFESYRKLGLSIAEAALEDTTVLNILSKVRA